MYNTEYPRTKEIISTITKILSPFRFSIFQNLLQPLTAPSSHLPSDHHHSALLNVVHFYLIHRSGILHRANHAQITSLNLTHPFPTIT